MNNKIDFSLCCSYHIFKNILRVLKVSWISPCHTHQEHWLHANERHQSMQVVGWWLGGGWSKQICLPQTSGKSDRRPYCCNHQQTWCKNYMKQWHLYRWFCYLFSAYGNRANSYSLFLKICKVSMSRWQHDLAI